MVGPQLLVTSAPIACSFGTAPSTLVATPTPAGPRADARQLAVVTDTRPVANVPSFGMCTSPTNPAVQAATAAASGVFTPAPCVPATGSPWTPGATAVRLNGVPAVPLTSQCACQWLGVVRASAAGQASVAGT